MSTSKDSKNKDDNKEISNRVNILKGRYRAPQFLPSDSVKLKQPNSQSITSLQSNTDKLDLITIMNCFARNNPYVPSLQDTNVSFHKVLLNNTSDDDLAALTNICLDKNDEVLFSKLLAPFGILPETVAFLRSGFANDTSEDIRWPRVIDSVSYNNRTKLSGAQSPEHTTTRIVTGAIPRGSTLDLQDSVFTNGVIGVPSLQRSEIMKDRIKQYDVDVRHNRLCWSEDFNILPSFNKSNNNNSSNNRNVSGSDDNGCVAIAVEPFRNPHPAVLELLRRYLHILDNHSITVVRNKDSSSSSSSSSSSDSNSSNSNGSNGDNCGIDDQSRNDLFINRKMISMNNNKRKFKVVGSCNNNGSNSSNVRRKLIDKDCCFNDSSQHVLLSSAAEFITIDNNNNSSDSCPDGNNSALQDIKIQLLERTVARHVEGMTDAVLEMVFQGLEDNCNRRDNNNTKRSTSSSSTSLEKECFDWTDILKCLQNKTAVPSNNVMIHNELPQLPLSENVIKRITYRLQALHSVGPLYPGGGIPSRSVPSVIVSERMKRNYNC